MSGICPRWMLPVALLCLAAPAAVASVNQAAREAEKALLQWTLTPARDFVCGIEWRLHPDGSLQDGPSDTKARDNLCLHKDQAVLLKRNRFNQLRASGRSVFVSVAGVVFQVRFDRKLTEADLAPSAVAGYLGAYFSITGPGLGDPGETNLVEVSRDLARLHQLTFAVPAKWQGRASAEAILFTRTRSGPRIQASVKAMTEAQLAAGVQETLATLLPDEMLATLAANRPDPRLVSAGEPAERGGLWHASALAEVERYTFSYHWFIDPATEKAYTFYTWWRTGRKEPPVLGVFTSMLDSVALEDAD